MDFQADFERFNEKYPIKSKQINGLTFNYRIGGNGDKTVVLLVGGLGISDAFYRHFDGFADSFTVLTFDYPIESRRNAELADGIAALIDELGLKNVFLVGQSYGGLLAQIITKRHPKIVAGLVLSNTGCLDADMDEVAMTSMLHKMSDLRKAILSTRLVPVPLLKGIILRQMEKNLMQCPPDEKKGLTDLYAYLFRRLTRRYERNMCYLMLDLKNEEIKKEHFSYLDKKVLLLLSDDDHTFDEPVKRALIGMMPNPVVCSEIKGGHLSLFVKPELYVRTITRFIQHID